MIPRAQAGMDGNWNSSASSGAWRRPNRQPFCILCARQPLILSSWADPLMAAKRAHFANTVSAIALAPFSVFADDETQDNPAGQSTFISPDKSLGFAFTVPKDEGNSVYFSLRVKKNLSWGAVGLGSDDMKGALYLMIYKSEDGKNVTFSPRLAYGNYEPEHYKELEIEALNGTGIFDDYMVFTAVCKNHCRSWPARDSTGGHIDVNDPSQRAIYALGPKENFNSNKLDAALKMHQEYGIFTIDMKRTMGAADAPVLTDKSVAEGTSLDDGSRHTHLSDYKAAIHGAFMVFFVMGVFPAGVLLLRLGRWARWHGAVQGFAMAGILSAFAVGILTSFRYQRSRSFNSYHQVIGYIVIAFILGQFTIGLLHHIQFQKTQRPSTYSKVHTWLGRIIIFLGTVNVFFGFSFAVNKKYGMIFASVLILLAAAIMVLSVFRRRPSQNKGNPLNRNANGNQAGYQPEPWRQNGGPSTSYDDAPPPGYEAPANQQHIGLQPVSPWKQSEAREYEDEPSLGAVQKPREFA